MRVIACPDKEKKTCNTYCPYKEICSYWKKKQKSESCFKITDKSSPCNARTKKLNDKNSPKYIGRLRDLA